MTTLFLVPIDKMAVPGCHQAIGAIFAYTMSERQSKHLRATKL